MAKLALPSLAHLPAEAAHSGIREIGNEAIRTPGAIQLQVGQPNFPTPQHIKDAGKRAIEKFNTAYDKMNATEEAIIKFATLNSNNRGAQVWAAEGQPILKDWNDVIDALYAEADVLRAKKSSVRGIDHPTLIVGLLNGGINTNVVPDRLTLRMDRRMIPEENPAAVEARVRSLIEDSVRGMDGIRVEIRRLLLANALTPLHGHEKLVAAIQKHGTRVFGEPIPAVGVPLYADARLYGEHGVPIVMYGAGPRTISESNAKRPDENLLLEELRRATHVVASSVHDLLQK